MLAAFRHSLCLFDYCKAPVVWRKGIRPSICRMPFFDDDEPVFKKQKWGNPRYAYNPRNPVGMFLIVASLVVGVVVLVSMTSKSPTESKPYAPYPSTDYSALFRSLEAQRTASASPTATVSASATALRSVAASAAPTPSR